MTTYLLGAYLLKEKREYNFLDVQDWCEKQDAHTRYEYGKEIAAAMRRINFYNQNGFVHIKHEDFNTLIERLEESCQKK